MATAAGSIASPTAGDVSPGLRTWGEAVAACPKHMRHGPCAGVDFAWSCEVPGFGPCAFGAVAGDDWPYLDGVIRSDGSGFDAPWPFVLTDLPVSEVSSAALLAAAEQLRDATDALLLGDHGGARMQFPPSYRARLLVDAGHPVWAGVNCRDRNRVAIEGELAACADVGVLGVNCVTGAHPSCGDRPDSAAVFDLDSLDVVTLAAAYALTVSVAHAPSAPPVDRRVDRLLSKAAAGAEVAVVDHCGGPDAVRAAVIALREAGFSGAVLVCVPAVFDADSAAVLESYARDRLPERYVARVLGSADPAAAGVTAAIELSAEVLAIPGVDGINLTGAAGGPEREVSNARRLAEIGRAVRAMAPVPATMEVSAR